jgi:hypothetical protein
MTNEEKIAMKVACLQAATTLVTTSVLSAAAVIRPLVSNLMVMPWSARGSPDYSTPKCPRTIGAYTRSLCLRG